VITATVKLTSASPYSQSKYIDQKKTKDQTHDEFELENWRQRLHVDANGFVFIPPMSFKNCIAEAAKYKSIQIPGKGKSTYTKHFEAGIMCCEPLTLPIKGDAVVSDPLMVPSDGRRGGTTRVKKYFPLIPSWSGDVEFLILDELIKEDVFMSHLEDAGRFIGIGRFRPRNNGYYGRFAAELVSWK
jgi:hypothetical protein